VLRVRQLRRFLQAIKHLLAKCWGWKKPENKTETFFLFFSDELCHLP
jgi:hypothetical protein